MPCCHHCRASRAHLHLVKENAGQEGSFEVIRCLICGWQICRLLPWQNKARRFLLEDRGEDLDEQKALSMLANVQKAALSHYRFTKAEVPVSGFVASLAFQKMKSGPMAGQ